MKMLSVLLAFCEWNAEVTVCFPSQRADNANDVFFDISVNNLLNNQQGWQWFQMPQGSCEVT